MLGTLIVLAIVPSVSVLAVSARAAAFGFTHGMFTALGIVVADILFIVIAVYGLALVAELMGNQFRLIQYIGAAYLIWLGISLWRTDAKARAADSVSQSSWWSSFLAGFLITLGDQKAILFYLGFFPAFINLSTMTPVARLLPGVLGDEQSAQQDSFMNGLLDCQHYTRPENIEGLAVPPVLLSGDHGAIERWRKKQSLGRTWLRRPELLEELALDTESAALLAEFKYEYRTLK